MGVELKQERPLLPVSESLDELVRLAHTAGLDVVGRTSQRLDRPNPATYIGTGKVEELQQSVTETKANVVVFDDELTPRHQRELEKVLGEEVKLLDRTALILDIFALHAHTHEGNLQVELAQLEYRLPRLTRMWTHLARQAGGRAGGAMGGVGLRGPGETQLEVDRREISRRISYLKEQLAQVRARRSQHRAKRQQTELRVVAIVGYTNAGKSTLLNCISDADVLSADMLFATLDPTTRKVVLPGGQEVLFTDTVGFIQKLPPQIVAAFRATLEEIQDADVLLHVVDTTHPQAMAQIEAVEETLAELEVDHLPLVVALNKSDLLPADADPVADLGVEDPAVLVSAKTAAGIPAMMRAVEGMLTRFMKPLHVMLPYQRGDLLAMLYERGQVDGETHSEHGVEVHGRLPGRLLPYFDQYLLDK